MAVAIKVSTSGMQAVESSLVKLPFLVRGVHLERGMKKGIKIGVDRAKQLVPFRHKRTGKDATKKHLRETIGSVYREYGSGFRVAVAGPQYPAGAHGHLVERGHRIVTGGTAARVGKYANKATPRSRRGLTGTGSVGGRTRDFPFMEPAFNEKQSAIEAAIIAELKKATETLA